MANNAKAGPSINNVITSAPTALAVAPMTASPTAPSPLDVVHEGWLLKKKRKKLQGYARRYFILRNNGSLCYSFGQGEEVRDQIHLNNAAFSSSPNDRYIHVDSGTATFHLRALTRSDYEEWMAALRKFISMPRPAGTLDAVTRHSVNYARTVNFSIGHATKMNAILDDMSKMIKDLTDVAQTLSEADLKQTASTKSKKDHLKESSRDNGFLGLFTRSPSKARSSIVVDDQEPTKEEVDPPKLSDDHIPLTFPGLLSGIDTLQQQHRQLTAAFNALLHLDGVTGPARAMSPTSPLHQDWIGIRVPSRAGTQRRALSIDTLSDEEVQWFDADDGPEEYLIEEQEQEAGTEPESKVVSEASSEVGQSIDTKEEEKEEPSVATPQPSAIITKPVQRRRQLPAPAPSTGMSLISVLKKNVGKDLSQVSFPVGFNEPISILQRLAEDLEYANLVDQAVASEDPVQRISLIAAFAVSGYACTRLRAARKPFNPMLGETFEDARFNFIAEKVCHVPPVMACHASGEGWTYDTVTQAKQKFWGRSLEIIPIGTTILKVGEDEFAWSKPSSFMRNIVAGTKYLEHVGTLTVTNRTTGARCDIEFKESTMWSSGKDVNATVYSPSGNIEVKLWGTWDGHFARMLSQKRMEFLWHAEDLPPDAQDYYGFTYFTTTLNEITEDLIISNSSDGNEKITYRIPVTDSRFRPDQRALEEGRMDEADELKMQVEETQRRRRRADNDAQPRWFKKVGRQDTDWEYAGGYWETRKEGWGEQEPLW